MPRLHIFIGSRSDLDAVKKSKMAEPLDAVGLNYEVHVCSADRNPDELAQYVRDACEGGAELFIGIAGLAAVLPGALASASKMMVPVLGVPLDEHGIDSCLYKPPGVPVATMGVGAVGLRNAAIFACQVLSQGSPSLEEALRRYLDRSTKQPEFNLEKSEIRPDSP